MSPTKRTPKPAPQNDDDRGRAPTDLCPECDGGGCDLCENVELCSECENDADVVDECESCEGCGYVDDDGDPAKKFARAVKKAAAAARRLRAAADDDEEEEEDEVPSGALATDDDDDDTADPDAHFFGKEGDKKPPKAGKAKPEVLGVPGAKAAGLDIDPDADDDEDDPADDDDLEL